MWLYLAVLVGLYYLLRWYRERQVVSHLWDKFVFITGCDSGFGNQLARQLDLKGLRVLAACLTEQGADQLRNQTSDRLQTVILDVTKTESVAAPPPPPARGGKTQPDKDAPSLRRVRAGPEGATSQ